MLFRYLANLADVLAAVDIRIKQNLIISNKSKDIGVLKSVGVSSFNVIRLFMGAVPAGVGSELAALLGSAVLTGLAGPPAFRLFRFIDGRFARTQRERQAPIGGMA